MTRVATGLTLAAAMIGMRGMRRMKRCPVSKDLYGECGELTLIAADLAHFKAIQNLEVRPILFLDFDRVLNSRSYDNGCDRPERAMPYMAHLIDPKAVQRLNAIVESTKCAIVVSSSWRHAHPVGDLLRILRIRGAASWMTLLGATPTGMGDPPRGLEIQAWLDANPQATGPIAILDDQDDMAHLRDRLVRTGTQKGLTDEEAAQTVAMLRTPMPGRTNARKDVR